MEFKKWIVLERREELQKQLVQGLSVSPIVAQILINRGFCQVDEARSFLQADISYDAGKLPDINLACQRIKKALDTGETIGIYGDYDADGLTGTALLTGVLRQMGGRVIPRVPHRLIDGYGLCGDVVQQLAQNGASLLITVDNGVSSVDEAQLAQSLGLDMIITDHHEVPENRPQAYALVNPKLPESTYPERELSGVGVAYKLACLLAGEALADQYLDLVALGTVADVVTLKGENRTLVKKGLEKLAQTDKPGLLALMSVVGINNGAVTGEHLGYVLGPRLNAVGRLDDANLALQLLLSQDMNEAVKLATQLEKHNKARQLVEWDIMESAQKLMDDYDITKEPVIVLSDAQWHPGVIGIVASRLVDIYHRPVLLIGQDGRGSGRSIKGFNLYQALQTCGDIFQRFGGHPMAAGLSIALDQIDIFREKINSYGREVLTEELLQPKVIIDTPLALQEITRELFDQLQMLQPHGAGNPAPVFALHDVQLTGVRTMGQQGDHLKLMLGDLEAVGWRMGNLAPLLERGTCLDLAFNLTLHRWNGSSSIQLRLKDFHLSAFDQQKRILKMAYKQVAVSSCTPFSIPKSPGHIKDARGQEKLGYIQSLLAEQKRLLILVNQQTEGKTLAKILNGQDIPFGFLHGGMPLQEQKLILDLAEQMPLLIVAAYPQIPLPSGFIHILWELPLSNQQLRWSASQELHMLFNQEDFAQAARTSQLLCPDREILGDIYRALREKWRYGTLFTREDLASLPVLTKLHSLAVSQACGIFLELGLLQQKNESFYLIKPPVGKLDLTLSILYNESITLGQDFPRFGQFMLTAPLHHMETLVGSENNGSQGEN